MISENQSTPWLLRRSPAHEVAVRLFCFPYAGGGASIFRQWQAALPDFVELCPIQLPGRENRITEPLIHKLDTIVENLSEAIYPFLDLPFAFFGHSLGARIAFETARNLRVKRQIAPFSLMVSGNRAPHIPEPNPLHHLPEDEFVRALRRFSGTPQIILENKELMAFYLPILRADFTVDETYVFQKGPILECPITAFGGMDDPEAEKEEIEQWAFFTSGRFNLNMMEGNHFFIETQRKQLLTSVSTILSRHREFI